MSCDGVEYSPLMISNYNKCCKLALVAKDGMNNSWEVTTNLCSIKSRSNSMVYVQADMVCPPSSERCAMYQVNTYIFPK